MITREVWIDGGVGLRFGGCCDCETGFASEFQCFVGGDAPLFAVHHSESSFHFKKYRDVENGRNGEGRIWGAGKGGK
jgi:hypothetical protein